MYRATGEDKYLTEARRWFDTQPDWGMSWDDKFVGCQVRVDHVDVQGDGKGQVSDGGQAMV